MTVDAILINQQFQRTTMKIDTSRNKLARSVNHFCRYERQAIWTRTGVLGEKKQNLTASMKNLSTLPEVPVACLQANRRQGLPGDEQTRTAEGLQMHR